MKTLRLLATFYRYFFLSAFLLTIACLGPFWRFGPGTLAFIYWFKVGTLGLTVLFISMYKKKELFYYRNLGLSPILLWTFTLAADLCLFNILIVLIYCIKWRAHTY